MTIMLESRSHGVYKESIHCVSKFVIWGQLFPWMRCKANRKTFWSFPSDKGQLVTNWHNQSNVNIKSSEFHLMSHFLPFPSSGLKQACCLQGIERSWPLFPSVKFIPLCILPAGFLILTKLKWLGQEEGKGAGNTVVSWCLLSGAGRC